MKTRVKVMASGALALAVGWFWICADPQTAGRKALEKTGVREHRRASDRHRQMGEFVHRPGLVVETLEISLSSDECRARAEEARIMVSPSLREEMTRRAVQEWAARDAAAALEWAACLSDANESRMAMMQVCTRLAEDDPAAAIRRAMDYRLDEVPSDFIGGLTAAWMARDLQSAREWVEGQPEGDLRDGLMGAVTFALAKSDPSSAARMVAEQMGAGEAQVEAAISVIHQWRLRDPEAAAGWVDTFPDGNLKERARSELWPETGVSHIVK